MEKLKSRKFWMCMAAMLASIATSVGGFRSDNEVIVAIGSISGILSAAIYAFCEAWVDGKAVYKEGENGKQSANKCIHCKNGTDCHEASKEA